MATNDNNDMRDSTRALDAVQKWIHETGYPLEFHVAKVLSNAGFTVTQSYYVNDINENKPKEIDIIATIEKHQMSLSLVVECKYAAKKPWIVLSSQANNLVVERYVRATIGTDDAAARMLALAQDEETKRLNLFQGFERSIYMVKELKSTGNEDLPYQAMQSVSTNALSLCVQRNSKDGHAIALFLPVVVIDGFVFECFYDDEIKILDTQARSHSLVHWRANNHRYLINIDLVTKSNLVAFGVSLDWSPKLNSI